MKLFTYPFYLLILLALSSCAKVETMQELEVSCSNGDPSKCLKIANRLIYHQSSHQPDSDSLVYLQKACDGGDMRGCDLIGKAYYSENSIELNEKKSKAAFKIACDNNYSLGCYHLGNFYNYGEERDFEKSLALLSKSCENGLVEACTRVGDMYYLGKGVQKDEEKADAFYKKDKRTYRIEGLRTRHTSTRYSKKTTKKIIFEMRSKNFNALKEQQLRFISSTGSVSSGTYKKVPTCKDDYYIYTFSNLVFQDRLKYSLFSKSKNYKKMVWDTSLSDFENTDFTDWMKPEYTTEDKKISSLDVLNNWDMKKEYDTDNEPIELRYKIDDWKKVKKNYVFHDEVKESKKIYVDFEKFKEGRFCSEIKFKCLPESKDKSFSDITLYNGLAILKLDAQAKKKFDNLIASQDVNYEKYHAQTHPICEQPPTMWFDTKEDDYFVDNYIKKRSLVEIEKLIEKDFPNFWGDTPKVVRYNWIEKAKNTAKEFSYEPNDAMVKLTARIGINFYRDPKWKYITDYIGSKANAISTSINYIDYTILNRRYDRAGNRFTSYLFGSELQYLPRIKNRTMPSFNDEFSWVWK